MSNRQPEQRIELVMLNCYCENWSAPSSESVRYLRLHKRYNKFKIPLGSKMFVWWIEVHSLRVTLETARAEKASEVNQVWLQSHRDALFQVSAVNQVQVRSSEGWELKQIMDDCLKIKCWDGTQTPTKVVHHMWDLVRIHCSFQLCLSHWVCYLAASLFTPFSA